MKRNILFLMVGALLLSGCNSAGEGAFAGGQFGYVIGSAIGGITGGHRGHDWGALIGTVSGVAAGAAIGAAAENAREKQRTSYDRGYERGYDRGYNEGYDEGSYDGGSSRNGGYDSGYGNRDRSTAGGNDRVDFGLSGPSVPSEPSLEIRNAAVTESRRDGVLTRGEECTVRFEIYNTSDVYVYDVHPLVSDVTGNKHVKISPNLKIESIPPRQGVRYTATVMADRKLKDGVIKVMVGVAKGRHEVKSQTRYFTVPTAKGVR